MKQLKVFLQGGEPKVNCPRCDELVVPVKNTLFDGFDCPECNQVISDSVLKKFKKIIQEIDEGLIDLEDFT